MDNDALLTAHDELMNAIMEEEEELVATHRKEIEEGMEILREVGFDGPYWHPRGNKVLTVFKGNPQTY